MQWLMEISCRDSVLALEAALWPARSGSEGPATNPTLQPHKRGQWPRHTGDLQVRKGGGEHGSSFC